MVRLPNCDFQVGFAPYPGISDLGFPVAESLAFLSCGVNGTSYQIMGVAVRIVAAFCELLRWFSSDQRLWKLKNLLDILPRIDFHT